MPRICLIIVLGLALTGCGGSEQRATIEKVVPVTGTLTYKGKPLEYHQVTFHPSDGRRVATGITDAVGHFTLGTNRKDDGAPPGSNRVTIVFVGPPQDPATEGTPIEEPAMMPQPAVKIPDHYANPETSQLTQEVPSSGVSDLKLDLQ